MRFNQLGLGICLESYSNRRLINFYEPNLASGLTHRDDTKSGTSFESEFEFDQKLIKHERISSVLSSFLI